MKTKNLRLALMPFLFILLFGSCKKDLSQIPATKDAAVNTVLAHIKSLGYTDAEIRDAGKEYIVDGDIAFPKNTVYQTETTGNSKLQVNQYGTANYLGLNKNVIVYLDPSLGSLGNIEAFDAILALGAVPNSRVGFVTGTLAEANVIIRNENLGNGICGVSYFPVNGNPGSLVRISLDAIKSACAATGADLITQVRSVVIHELGHAIGLRHTNWHQLNEPANSVRPENQAKIAATNILGTPPDGDPASIMNGGTCGAAPADLSAYDKIAIQFIYPLNPPVQGAVPVFRYHNANFGDHFYTTSYGELNDGNNNDYIFEGVGFYAFSTQVSGSVPVYRFVNLTNGDHFYTTTNGTYGGYTPEGIRFYAMNGPVNGATPVLRYLGGIDHFYTKNPNEFYYGLAGYSPEGTAFYAY